MRPLILQDFVEAMREMLQVRARGVEGIDSIRGDSDLEIPLPIPKGWEGEDRRRIDELQSEDGTVVD
jgi:hypothetical protein